MPVNTLGWNRLRYSLYSPFYDLTERLFHAARRQAHEMISIQPGERVLLMGCGTGLDLDYLPAGVEIMAVDLSPAMVARCQARAERLGMNVQAKVMNAEKLALDASQFDVVILHLVVSVIPNPVSCMQEAARVLRQNGRLSILDKFVPAGQKPSILRKGINLITNLLFSDITRSLEPLINSAGLYIKHDQPVLFGNAYRAVTAEKLKGITKHSSVIVAHEKYQRP